MGRIDFRVRESNPILLETTDPGILVEGQAAGDKKDHYVAPEITSQEKSVASGPRGFFAKRRAVKEARAAAQKIERLENVPDAAVRNFFTHDLSRLVAASQIDPERVQKLLQIPGPWATLIQMACGDPAAFLEALENRLSSLTYLFALEKVAAYKPKEATHLLKQFFEGGELNQRLAALRTSIVSPHLGDGHLIGEFFVKLMAASTPEERKETVEPCLNSLIQKSAATGKRAWLSAYYHGWQQENLG